MNLVTIVRVRWIRARLNLIPSILWIGTEAPLQLLNECFSQDRRQRRISSERIYTMMFSLESIPSLFDLQGNRPIRRVSFSSGYFRFHPSGTTASNIFQLLGVASRIAKRTVSSFFSTADFQYMSSPDMVAKSWGSCGEVYWLPRAKAFLALVSVSSIYSNCPKAMKDSYSDSILGRHLTVNDSKDDMIEKSMSPNEASHRWLQFRVSSRWIRRIVLGYCLSSSLRALMLQFRDNVSREWLMYSPRSPYWWNDRV